MSQHYDAAEYLGALFGLTMTIIFGLGWWISTRKIKRHNRRHALPPPMRDDRDSIQQLNRMSKT